MWEAINDYKAWPEEQKMKCGEAILWVSMDKSKDERDVNSKVRALFEVLEKADPQEAFKPLFSKRQVIRVTAGHKRGPVCTTDFDNKIQWEESGVSSISQPNREMIENEFELPD